MSDTDPQENEMAPAEQQEGEQPVAQTVEQEGTDPQLVRLLEAVLFASGEPLDESVIATRLPEGTDVPALIAELVAVYASRGVNLVQAGGLWMFRTAEDLAPMMRVYATQARKLSRAAIETLAICAYHQPITRAEMEEIRGVGLSKGTIDMLFEQGWIMPRGRRQTPGKPVTWGTTEKFLVDFGIDSLEALPGMDELKAAGLLDKRPAIQITDAALPFTDDEIPQGENGEGNPLAEDDRLMEDAAADFDHGAPVIAKSDEEASEGDDESDEDDEDADGDDSDDDESDDDDDEDDEDDDFDDDDDEEEESDDDEDEDDAPKKPDA